MTANELADELVWIAKNRGDSISRQLADIVRQQQAEIEALKKDTIPYKDLHQVVKNVLAQPMRELSDEEIEELSEQHLDWNWQTGNIDFARAILRKASEK